MSSIVDVLKRLPRRKSGVRVIPYRRRASTWFERHFFSLFTVASISLGAAGVWRFAPTIPQRKPEPQLTPREREIALLKAEAEKIELEQVPLTVRAPRATALLEKKDLGRAPASVPEVIVPTEAPAPLPKEERYGASFVKKNAQAIALYRAKKFTEAFDEFKKLNEVKPNDVGVLVNLAMTAKQLKKLEDAEAYTVKALNIDPKNPRALNNYGMLCLGRGDFEGAERNFAKAVSVEPSYADAVVNRGWALELMNEYQSAVESYQTYIQLTEAAPATKKIIQERMRRLLALARIQSAPRKEDL